MRLTALFVGLIVAATATSARADPCKAALPTRAGSTFEGVIRYIGDGDSLCIGLAPDPATWIEVRLADFDAPELHAVNGSRAKELLTQVALGRSARCVAQRGRLGKVQVYDRVIATCTINGVTIGRQLRLLNAPEGGN